MSTGKTWLTQEAFDRLTKELAHLSGEGRTEIIERIEAARSEGDLKENGGYHAAREEQAKLEGRINELKVILRNAEVGEAPADDGVVESGMVVTVKLRGKTKTFLLGSREAAAGLDLEVISERAPLGAAIIGLSVGANTEYQAPNGKSIAVEIIEAKPFKG